MRGLLARTRPSAVFNAAAYTDVDRAEREPDRAHAANATGAEIVAGAAAEVGATVVHYSTDFVFDGTQERPYDERDPTSPQGPRHAVLDNRALRDVGLDTLSSWQDALRAFVAAEPTAP